MNAGKELKMLNNFFAFLFMSQYYKPQRTIWTGSLEYEENLAGYFKQSKELKKEIFDDLKNLKYDQNQ